MQHKNFHCEDMKLVVPEGDQLRRHLSLSASGCAEFAKASPRPQNVVHVQFLTICEEKDQKHVS